MTIIILFLFSASIYILWDLVPIYKQKQWKVFWIYTIILFLDFILALLTALDIPIPSPSFPVKKMIYTILGL